MNVSAPENPTAAALTPTARALAWCVHVLALGLLALAGVRPFAEGQQHAPGTAAAAAVCAAVYLAGVLAAGRQGHNRRAAAWWLAAVGAGWLVLLALTPDGVWVAFPLYFLQLHLLPRRVGPVAVSVTALMAAAAFAAHQGAFGPAMVIGPALGAAVAVAVEWGYRALYRESEHRRRLIEELTATRADLAEAQHAAGVLAERERLAREIHDTLAQGLSSIQLLLRAAERSLPGNPATAVRHVVQARQAAVDNLDEARRFVAALTPPALEDATLAKALERLCETVGDRHGIDVRLGHGPASGPLPTSHEVALLRIAQSALANTVRHSGAAVARVHLSGGENEVTLEISDDGCGFDVHGPPGPGPESGGYGIAGMRARARALDGTLDLTSAPARGTTVRVRLPVPPAAFDAARAADSDAGGSTAQGTRATDPSTEEGPRR